MKWKSVSMITRACQDSNFLRKWLFSVITNAAFKCLQFLNKLAVLLVRNIVAKGSLLFRIFYIILFLLQNNCI